MRMADKLILKPPVEVQGANHRPQTQLADIHGWTVAGTEEDIERWTTGGGSVPRPVKEMSISSRLQESIPRIDATNVFKWVQLEEAFDLYEHWSCLLPPWTEAWFEWEHERATIPHTKGRQVGCYFTARKMGEDWWDVMSRKGTPWITENLPHDLAWRQCEWMLCMSLFVSAQHLDQVMGPVISFAIPINGAGRPLDIRWFLSREADLGKEDQFLVAFSVVLQAIDFAHCRNVTLDREFVDPAVRKAREKRARKRGEHKPLTYSLIRIDPNSTTSSGRAGSGDAEDRVYHIVRGHVAHYGNCCPGAHPPNGKLFGKIEGKVFMPQHARGSKEVGLKGTDYIVEPTTDDGD
jgi:hypothetical protein